MPIPRRRVVLATWLIANAAAGDALRNVIGYPAWGAVAVATFLWLFVELALLRVRLGRVPVSVIMFVVLAVVSASWALSPWWSLVGSFALIGMVAGAIFVATLPYRMIVDIVHWSLQGLLALSILFELFVALVLRRPLFPLWSDYPPGTTAEWQWSGGLILDGGRVQGVMGNANLLAMAALLALIVAGCRAAARIDRLWPLWVALPLLSLGLARSATVSFAVVAVAIIAGLIVAWVRWRGAIFYRIFAIAIAAAAVAIALIVDNWDWIAEFLGREAGMSARVAIWDRVLALVIDSPIVGVGYLGYWMPWVEPFDAIGLVGDTVYLHAHNVWLDVVLQLGLVGLIVWTTIQGQALANCLGAMYRSPARDYALNAAPLLMWVALFVQGLAESRPWIEFGMILLIIFAIGRTRRQIAPRAPVTVAMPTVS